MNEQVNTTEITEQQISTLLEGYSSVATLPVQWGEMDVANHVNNAIYLRYAETARIAYFDEAGYSMSDFTKIAPILAEITAQYKIPLVFPDTVIMGTKVVKVGTTSLVMETVMLSKKLQKVAAIVNAVVVMFDYSTNQKAPIPEIFKNKIIENERL